MTAQRSPVRIIAEAAQGFEGDARLARLLVKAARAGTADTVKFQLVFADELATRDYAYYGLFKNLEMPPAAWRGVADDAVAAGIGLAFDVFGPQSLDFALELGAEAVKLHSTDFFNRALVRAALDRAPHVYFSMGGIEYAEVQRLLDATGTPADRFTLMFGFQGEPTTIDQNHIARMAALTAAFPGVRIGFMDHADGASDEAQWLGVVPLALGAVVIEKHITVDRALELEDWVSALDPSAFARYAARIRTAERALGSAAFELSDAERDYGRRAVKLVVAGRPISAGATIGEGDVVALRAPVPDGRTVLRQIDTVVGRQARLAIAAGRPVCEEDLA